MTTNRVVVVDVLRMISPGKLVSVLSSVSMSAADLKGKQFSISKNVFLLKMTSKIGKGFIIDFEKFIL